MDPSPPDRIVPATHSALVPAAHSAVVGEPAVPPPRKSRFFARLLLVLLVLGFLGSLGLNLVLLAFLGLAGVGSEGSHVREEFDSHNRWGVEKVAILSIEGTILTGDGFFKQQLDHARKDAESGMLKLVVRVNSPGGTISGSDYMLHHLRKLAADTHMPVVVSMGGLAASGGYYVSMCVGDEPNSIFAEPTTWTGSIGVIIPHYDLAELMQKLGIQEDAIASNPLKTMGSLARKMTEANGRYFRTPLNEGFTQFKEPIKEDRPKFRKDPRAWINWPRARCSPPSRRIQAGLIDKIGFVEDAIERVIRLGESWTARTSRW